MEFQDRNIECIDCHASFVFTAGEQEFYERKGFKEVPKRCKDCRDKRKAKRDSGGGGGERSYGGGGGGNGYGNDRGYSSGGYEGGNDRGYGGGGGYGDDIGNRASGRGGGGGGGGGAGGGQREFFDAVCAACGAPARVPFRPAAGRPVYCRDCYSNRSGGGY